MRRAPEVWLLFAACLILVARVSFATPPFSAPDEGAHYLRAHEVRRFRFVNYPGRWSVRMRCDEYIVAAKKYALTALYTDEAERRIHEDKCRVKAMNSASTFPALSYLPSVAVFRLGELTEASVETKLYWSRATNGVLGCIAMLIGLLAVDKMRPLLALLFLFPMSFWQRSALSADAMLLSSQFIFVCYVVRMAEQRNTSRKLDWAVLFLAAFVIASTKGSYWVTCLFALSLWFLRPPTEPAWRFLARLLSPAALSCFFAMGWSRIADLAYQTPFQDWGINPEKQKALIAADPWKFVKLMAREIWDGADGMLRQIVGHAAWLAPSTAMALSCIYYGLMMLLMASTPNPFPRRARAGLAVLALGPAIASFPQTYITWTPVGAEHLWGLQGRYFLPLLLIFAVAGAFERSGDLALSPRVKNALGMGVPCLLIAWLAWTRL